MARTHTAAQLLGWVVEQRVLHSVFEGADAHEQLQEQSVPLLAFMAERGHFGAAALASVWAPVAAGRDVDIGQQLVFDKLLKPLVRQGCSSSSGASAAAPWLGAPVLLSMLARLTPAALEGAGGVTDHALDLIALIARHSAQPGVPVAPGGGGGGGGAADGACAGGWRDLRRSSSPVLLQLPIHAVGPNARKNVSFRTMWVCDNRLS
jgi:hypothetical protein